MGWGKSEEVKRGFWGTQLQLWKEIWFYGVEVNEGNVQNDFAGLYGA